MSLQENREAADAAVQPIEPVLADTPEPGSGFTWTGFAGGLVVVLLLGVGTYLLTKNVPVWTKGTWFGSIATTIEFPLYAIILGLLGNLSSPPPACAIDSPGFRTEFFIKTGLVLLGASINFAVIVKAAGPAIAQAVLLISFVFLFTWWLAGRLGIDDKLRALLAVGGVDLRSQRSDRGGGRGEGQTEHLAYTASLVIVFALPSIFMLPWLAGLLGLSDAVAGAWIGGNIDTTAAVTAAGAIAGEEALQIATSSRSPRTP